MDLSEISRMKITEEILPLAFQNEIIENGDTVIIRSNIKSMTEITQWVKDFGVRTKTKWTVRSSWPEREKFVCKKLFVCHHSSFNKVPAPLNKRGKSKNTDCLASISVKVKLNTFSTRRYDKFIKKGLVGMITISPFHNHNLQPVETANFNPVEVFRIKKEKSPNEDLKNIPRTPEPSYNTTSHSTEYSIEAENSCLKNERLLCRIKTEDSSKDELENVSLDSITVYNSESNLIAANHETEKSIQADNKRRKKELSEQLLDLLGNGLEKFETSETALESAVKQLEKISSDEEWEAMLSDLGSTVPSVEVLEEAIMLQYKPIAPKPLPIAPKPLPIVPKPMAVTKSFKPLSGLEGNKQPACDILSFETPAIQLTPQTIYIQLPI